ncbi:MAG: hypothetical protein ACRELD_13845 [Longimicrobiales bacterium]
MIRRPPFITLCALLLAITVAGCDAPEMLAPSPDVAVPARASAGLAKGKGKHQTYTPVVTTQDLASVTASDRLGRQGGELVIQDFDGVTLFRLVVGRGSVQTPTVFTMTNRAGNVMAVDLTATALGNDRDVGESGFRRPVRLYMSLHYVEVADGALIALDADGTYEPVNTWREGDYLVADLAHFSGYIIVGSLRAVEE